jgi:hypothetical protein
MVKDSEARKGREGKEGKGRQKGKGKGRKEESTEKIFELFERFFFVLGRMEGREKDE